MHIGFNCLKQSRSISIDSTLRILKVLHFLLQQFNLHVQYLYIHLFPKVFGVISLIINYRMLTNNREGVHDYDES